MAKKINKIQLRKQKIKIRNETNWKEERNL